MAKKQIPDTASRKPVFEIGDLVSTQKGILKVILNVTKEDYQFMQLKDEYFETTAGRDCFMKGHVATQPQSIFDKYHYLYQP